MPVPQLYNLTTDRKEKSNIANSQPGKLKELQLNLEDILNRPTRPGYKK